MPKKDYTLKQERTARFAKAMGHPARIAILEFLAKQTQCYFGDIYEELPIAKATVSQHLNTLSFNRPFILRPDLQAVARHYPPPAIPQLPFP